MPEGQNESKHGDKPATSTTKAEPVVKRDKVHAEDTAETSKGAEAIVKTTDAAESAAKAAEEAEAAAKAAIQKAEIAKAAAEAAAKVAIDAEYKAIADTEKAGSSKVQAYTFKRENEEIFKRELGEPEFFLQKKDRFPLPILSQEQQDELTRKAETPVDNTPKYEPERLLSPEYGGVSNYESGVGSFLEEARMRLEKLKKDPDATSGDIARAKHDVSYLASIHENFFLGMNVFRTAKGGRSKLQK